MTLIILWFIATLCILEGPAALAHRHGATTVNFGGWPRLGHWLRKKQFASVSESRIKDMDVVFIGLDGDDDPFFE